MCRERRWHVAIKIGEQQFLCWNIDVCRRWIWEREPAPRHCRIGLKLNVRRLRLLRQQLAGRVHHVLWGNRLQAGA